MCSPRCAAPASKWRAVVVGPDSDAVADEARRMLPKAEIFVQSERRGTAHAVLAARAAIEQGADDILVIFGDTPLISAGDAEARCAARSIITRASRCSAFARTTRPATGG